MDTGMSQYEEKLSKLLDTFLTPAYQIKSERYLNGLVSHLSGKDDKELGNQLLHLPVLIEWVLKAITHWEQNEQNPSLSISTFTLNLIALLSKDENIFVHYNIHNVYPRIFKIFHIHTHNIPPTIKLAYIKILSSLLEHRTGLDWIRSNDVWKDCLNFCLANQTIYIIKEGHTFIYNLLVKSIEVNEPLTHLVVDEIVAKFNEDLCREGTLFPEIEDEILQKQLRPTVKLISFIFNNLIVDYFKKRDYRVANVFINFFHLEQVINKIVILARNVDFLYDLYSILYQIYFFNLGIATKTELFACTDVCTLAVKIFDLFKKLCPTQINNVMKLAHLVDYMWNLLKDRLPEYPFEVRAGKEPVLFQNQLISLQVLPIFAVAMVHLNIKITDLDEDDCRDAFTQSWFDFTCENTIRLAYVWRTTLMSQTDAFDNSKLCIMHLLRNIKNFDKPRGIVIFKSFMYTFKDINISIRTRPDLIEIFLRNNGFVIALLEAIAVFIVEFEITWRESVETICITSATLEMLKTHPWPTRIVVQAMKLVKLSIERFLSPQMALLMEDEEVNLQMLGAMINAKLYDVSWEVRDSALELMYVIANISNRKYPSFQTMLMELDIITLVVTMCTSDSEGFVRASAIKCLQQMIQVHTLWSQVLVNQELPKKMMHILRHESEAIVRTEAASLMRYIHEYQSFPNELMNEVYESMAYAATCDLHWEVKSNALDFWGKVILNHLQDQGFIDGKFPNVTFSKEHRKIVTLTEKEIKSRLCITLQKLSKNGCLGVLVNAIQDDCDLEVAKKAIMKAKKVAKMLDMYDISSSYQEGPLPSSPVLTIMSTPPLTPKIDFSDEVLDDIINSKDINLLENCYNPDYETVSNGIHNSLKVVTPEMFVNFIQKDLDFMITEKTKWLNKMDDFNSLLDDMLRTYESNNINAMDCY